MKYPAKYINTVRSNSLNGSALIFGDADDLKKLLGMNFGEWATFRLHFLGLPAHLRPQHKKLWPTPSPPKNQLSIFTQNVAHQYSSNPKMGNS